MNDSAREHLRNHTPESLAARWPDLGIELPLARRIVSRLVAEDRDDLDGVAGLRRAVREGLRVRGCTTRLQIVDRRMSRSDPFVKYLLAAPDGSLVETVRLPLEQPRWSACLSSQVGCAQGCRFCATGQLGFGRNLEAWEMVDQALVVRREGPERPLSGVVFQGQGEPLANYANVLRAAYILRDACGGRIGADRISICTVGLVPEIERYTAEGHPFRLLVSLTSAFDERRARVMPITRKHPVSALARAVRAHARARRGIAHLSWVLIGGFNTGEEEADALLRLFPDVRLRLSLVELSGAPGGLAPPPAEERERFISALAARGIAFVRRYSGGADIAAACGMLAATRVGGEVWTPVSAARPGTRARSSRSSRSGDTTASPGAAQAGRRRPGD